MRSLQILFVVLVAAAAGHAQSIHLGSCPLPGVEQDFDITKYLGRWYEIEKLPAAFQRGKCHQATYSPLPDGTVHVINSELLPNGQVNSIEGKVKVKDPSQPAILEVSFFEGVPGGPYWVLSTDYLSYALVYSCTNYLGLFYVDFAWVLARTRTLPDDVMSGLRDDLRAAGVDTSLLTVTGQTGCESMP